jgi:hypothetical protein
MDRPNTIWISLRKPPDVSPKASARPVAMMMMTATMRATGPWMDSRMDCSGPSQGIEEPAACAVPASSSMKAASSKPCMAGRARPPAVRAEEADLRKYGKHQRASWQFSRWSGDREEASDCGSSSGNGVSSASASW